ncbi:MAG: hypothetical protein K2P42_07325 [Lachnospiraceae bacterium]|nr:hypothetical protein [Lachnospiraceae bacterium]
MEGAEGMDMKFLREDMKRSFSNPGFFAGCFGLGALLTYNFVTESLHSGSPYYAIVNILAVSGFTVFLPVFPVLGYASRFCSEYESGYYRLILARMKPRKFARVRIISVAMSGGTVVALPYLFICLLAVALEMPGLADMNSLGLDASGVNVLKIPEDIEMAKIGMTYGIGVMVALKVLLGFLFGAAWALVGLAFAVWMPNQYVALVAPFVLYESLYILMPNGLNPAVLVRGDDAGHLLSVELECVWLLAAAAVSMAGFKRRCRDA